MLEPTYLLEIRAILQTARNTAMQAVNSAMVEAYWNIGKRLVEEQQAGSERANYGTALLKELSVALGNEFGNGFSVSNLENFRKFYLTFPSGEKSYALRKKLSWTHYRLIIRVENEQDRRFYLEEAAAERWSTRQLERAIKTNLSLRSISKVSNVSTREKQNNIDKFNFNHLLKDPYVFEFLNIPQPAYLSESELEKMLIEHLKSFLLELGKGFSFVGQQFRISSETKHFYLDLVFYNYLIKCFIVVDLKTGALTHQDIGQLDMYVRMFDDLKKGLDDNPTVGIILCAEKDNTIVKYSVLNDNDNLFASKYLTYLPSKEELEAHIAKDRLFITEKFKEKNKN